MLNSFFIRKPMKWNFIITVVLDFISLICLIYLTFSNPSFSNFTFLILFIIFEIFFIVNNRGDLKLDLGDIRNQIMQNSESNILQFSRKFILYSFKYILVYLIIKQLLDSLAFNEYWEIILYFTNQFIRVVTIILLFSRLIFSMLAISPFLSVLYIFIPLFLFSIIGIEKSFFNWTFLALLIVTVILQFINEDIKFILPKEDRENINLSGDDLKERLYRIKFNVLLFIPFFYCSLLLSEKISTSSEFMYLTNLLVSNHTELNHSNYFSFFTFASTILKLIVVLFSMVIVVEYKESFFSTISKFLFSATLKDNSLIKNGKFFSVRYDRKNKKWEINRRYYYYQCNRMFIKIKTGEKGEFYTVINQKNLASNKSAIKERILFISGEILKINSDYFVLDKSNSMKKINGAPKYTGLNILKRPDHSVWIWPIILLLISIGASLFLNNRMETAGRGEYNLVIVKRDKSLVICDDKKINLKGNKLEIENNSYTYDNTSMTIKDNTEEKVGEINGSVLKVTIQDKEQYYVLKDSNIYKQYKN